MYTGNTWIQLFIKTCDLDYVNVAEIHQTFYNSNSYLCANVGNDIIGNQKKNHVIVILLLVIVLSDVILWLTASDYPFGIFRVFLMYKSIASFLNIWFIFLFLFYFCFYKLIGCFIHTSVLFLEKEIYHIRILSENIKFICTSFRNR